MGFQRLPRVIFCLPFSGAPSFSVFCFDLSLSTCKIKRPIFAIPCLFEDVVGKSGKVNERGFEFLTKQMWGGIFQRTKGQRTEDGKLSQGLGLALLSSSRG